MDPPAWVRSVVFNHNGSLLLCGTADGMIRLFGMETCPLRGFASPVHAAADMSSYTALMGWRAHEGAVLAVRFSADETSFFSLGADAKLLQWNVHNMGRVEMTYEYEPHADPAVTARCPDLVFHETGMIALGRLAFSSPQAATLRWAVAQVFCCTRWGTRGPCSYSAATRRVSLRAPYY
jgi:WD40 repeat protein